MIYDLETGARRRSFAQQRFLSRRQRLARIGSILAIIAILLVGLYFRTLNVVDWDERQFVHPDERFVAYTVFNLQLPHSMHEYFDSTIAPLNPRNYEWSGLFVYGTLPTTITRVVVDSIGKAGPAEVVVVGRVLSGVFDLIACLALFFLGRRIYGRGVGLLAAALYAVTVMPIQQAHFFTTDNFSVAFSTLALVAAVRLGLDGRWRDAFWSGLFTGAAVASKINLAALAGVIALAAFQALLMKPRANTRPWSRGNVDGGSQRWIRSALLLAVAGATCFASFRILQPDAFTGPSIWNIWPEPRFLANLRDVRGLVNGTIDMPPSHQWAGRPPYLFALQNMIVWGMGLPLGLAAWSGFLLAGYRLARPRPGTSWQERWAPLIPWVWTALYFAWQGGGFNPSLRYFLPIYPPLILFAAWGSFELGAVLTQQRQVAVARRTEPSRLIVQGLLPAAVLLACTASWAWAFTRIYTRPHTRIAAARWVLDNAPHGSTLTNELWDDPLPYTGSSYSACEPLCALQTHPYAEDEPAKYLGGTPQTPVPGADPNSQDFAEGLISQLARADYVALASARVYSSIVRLPHRYPATLRYYQALFDGSLGFELVGDFHSFPTLFGLPIPDLSAEEQFTVYDHPRVLIFRRTERFNVDTARELLTRGVNWDEIYKISALTTSAAPTALRLTSRSWSLLQETDSRYLFDGFARFSLLGARSAKLVLGSAIWLLAIELLALASLGMIWRWRVPLPDRGLLTSRLAGLLMFALPPALLAASGRIGVSRIVLGVWYGLVLGIGLRFLLAERRGIGDFVRHYRAHLFASQLLYGTALALAGVLRWLCRDLVPSSTTAGPAQWAALLRSPVLPAPDPLFAGGQLVTPYAALLPFAQVTRLVGLEPFASFNLALAATAALLVSLVAAAVVAPLRVEGGVLTERMSSYVRGRSSSGWALLPSLLAVLVVIAPGLPMGSFGAAVRPLLPLGALAAGNLAALSLAMLVAGAIVCARAFRLPGDRRHGRPRAYLVAALPLMLVAAILGLILAQAYFAILGVLLPTGAIVYLHAIDRRDDRRTPALVALGVLIVAMLVLARPFAAIAPSAEADLGGGIAIGAAVSSLLLVIAAVTAYVIAIGLRLAGAGMTLLAGCVMIGWTIVGIALNWPLWMIGLPAALPMAWLMLDAILGGSRLRASAQPLSIALGSIVLLSLADTAASGILGGDPVTLITSGVTLAAMVAGSALPVLARLARLPRRRLSVFACGLLLGMVAVAGGEALRAAPLSPNISQVAGSPTLAAAVDRLAREAQGTPVVAMAPTTETPFAVARTGVSALLASPDAEARMRAILRPSFDAIVDGRLRALDDIYGSAADRAAKQLSAYDVQYVLLGADERNSYGPEAGAALRELAANGKLRVLYDQDDVTLFQHAAASNLPFYVAQPVALDVPTLKDGLLDVPLAQLPIVGEYGWNRVATRSAALAIALWVLLFEAIGLLAWPLCRRIFTHSLDAGWSWSKVVGWLIWGYAIWLPVSLGWWLYRWPSLIAGLLVLGGLSWWASGRPVGRAAWRAAFSPGGNWREVAGHMLRAELLFLFAFAVWLLVRAANPDLWHPIFGGEKPFELGMLNAIVRSPVMPPPDPFFSGGIINYYYYGLFLASAPIRATGIDPAIAFNLLLPTLFALVVCGATAVVRDLTERWRWGLLGAAMVAVLGPVGSAVPVGESRGAVVALRALREGFDGWGARLGDWFWGPSRIIPHTINEFPYFSFLFSDLHPHMIALAFTLLGIAIAVELADTGLQRLPRTALWLAALLIGTLAATNSWDAPTTAMVMGGALVGRAWRIRQRYATWQLRAWNLGGSFVLSGALLGGGLLLFLPFFQHYQAMVGGIGRVRFSDTLLHFVALYGLPLYVSLTLLGVIGWVVSRRAERHLWRRIARGAAVAAPLLAIGLLLGGATFARIAQDASRGAARVPILAVVLLGLAAFALVLLLVARLRDAEWMNVWLIAAALLVALGIQLVFIRDHLAGSDWERMNTVFKFGLQIWTLLAVGAAAAMPRVLRFLRRQSEAGLGIWIGALLLLLFAASTYPVIATPSRLAMRFPEHPGLTLDGLAYMETARYEQRDQPIELRWDADAIRWMKNNLPGLPVVLQSEAEFYRQFGVRVAAATGFPTVVSGLHEDEQRPEAQVRARIEHVQTIYSTTDPAVALGLIDRYHVDYVYVGPAERIFYDEAGLHKWQQMAGTSIDKVFDNGGVQIYRVRPTAAPVVSAHAPPAGRSTRGQTQSQGEQPAANLQDVQSVYVVVQRYQAAGRLEDAVQLLRDAIAIHPRDITLRHFLGDIQAELGQADEAIAAWTAAMNLDPTAGNTAKLGNGLVQLGRYDEAEGVLRTAQQRDPDDPLIHFYLAQLFHRRNGPDDVARAREAYQLYLDQSPQDSPFRGIARQALTQLGR